MHAINCNFHVYTINIYFYPSMYAIINIYNSMTKPCKLMKS